MYTVTNPVNRVLTVASKFVIDNDRSIYSAFLKATEEFVAEHKLVVGGTVGADLLLQKPYSKDVTMYELYVDSPWQRAKELVDAFGLVHAPHIDKTTIVANTVIKNMECTVSVNTRVLIRLYNLPRIRDANIRDIIVPVYRKGYFADREVLVMPADLQLINIYRQLYRPYPPVPHLSYTDLLAREDTLFSHLDFGIKIGGVCSCCEAEGGDEELPDTDHETVIRNDDREIDIDALIEGGCDECKCVAAGCTMCIEGGCDCNAKTGGDDTHDSCCEDDVPVMVGGCRCMSGGMDEYFGSHQNWRQQVEQTVIDEVIRRGDMLLVGDFAVKHAVGTVVSNMRLQVIAGDDINAYVDKIRTALANAKIKTKVEYTKYALQIPNDFQTYKYTVYVQDHQGKRTSLLDIFNCTAFELVPYTVARDGALSGIMIAGTFAILRVKLIDLYSMKFVSHLSGASATQGRVGDIKGQIVALRKHVRKEIDVNPLTVFQLENYSGQYLDESVEKRKLLGKERFRFAPYYLARSQQGDKNDKQVSDSE